MTARRDVMLPYLRKFDIAYSDIMLADPSLQTRTAQRHHTAFDIAIKLFPASEDAFQENARILAYLLIITLM